MDALKEAEGILYWMICVYNANNSVDSKDDVVVDDTTTAVKAADRVISSLVWPEMRDFRRLINCSSFVRNAGTETSKEDGTSLL